MIGSRQALKGVWRLGAQKEFDYSRRMAKCYLAAYLLVRSTCCLYIAPSFISQLACAKRVPRQQHAQPYIAFSLQFCTACAHSAYWLQVPTKGRLSTS
jgi:hypothetical protein